MIEKRAVPKHPPRVESPPATLDSATLLWVADVLCLQAAERERRASTLAGRTDRGAIESIKQYGQDAHLLRTRAQWLRNTRHRVEKKAVRP